MQSLNDNGMSRFHLQQWRDGWCFIAHMSNGDRNGACLSPTVRTHPDNEGRTQIIRTGCAKFIAHSGNPNSDVYPDTVLRSWACAMCGGQILKPRPGDPILESVK